MLQRHQQLHRNRIFSRPSPLWVNILSIEDLNRDLQSPTFRDQDTTIEDHTTAALILICETTITAMADMTHETYATVATIDPIRNSIATNAKGKAHGRLRGQSHRER